jgi:hypothetical protein
MKFSVLHPRAGKTEAKARAESFSALRPAGFLFSLRELHRSRKILVHYVEK